MRNRANQIPTYVERRGLDTDGYRPDDVTDWDYVRLVLRTLRDQEGIPSQLDDLSVDDFTAHRLAKTDFAGIIKIWRKPDGVDFHPGIATAIEDALTGRDPEIFFADDPLIIHLNVEDDSVETKAAVEFFGLRLALILDGLPRVVVGRYRNFGVEDQEED